LEVITRIKDKMEETVAQMEDIMVLMEETSALMEDIMVLMEEIPTLMEDIMDPMEETPALMEEIMDPMEEVDRTMEISISLVLPITSAAKDTETAKLIATVVGDCSAERTTAGESSGLTPPEEFPGRGRTTAALTTPPTATPRTGFLYPGVPAVLPQTPVLSATATAILTLTARRGSCVEIITARTFVLGLVTKMTAVLTEKMEEAVPMEGVVPMEGIAQMEGIVPMEGVVPMEVETVQMEVVNPMEGSYNVLLPGSVAKD